jgi:ankyrin repeat protein
VWWRVLNGRSAACEGDAETLRRLIKEGQSAAGPDHDSWTPLHYAAWCVWGAAVRCCLSLAGAVWIGCLPCDAHTRPGALTRLGTATRRSCAC